MYKCNQLTHLPFKGLKTVVTVIDKWSGKWIWYWFMWGYHGITATKWVCPVLL